MKKYLRVFSSTCFEYYVQTNNRATNIRYSEFKTYDEEHISFVNYFSLSNKLDEEIQYFQSHLSKFTNTAFNFKHG